MYVEKRPDGVVLERHNEECNWPKIKGQIKRIKIVSNDIYFGLCPKEGLEVEQHLTICSDGRVYFTGYAFAEDLNYIELKQCRRKNFKINSIEATYLVNMVAMYFKDNHQEWFATDIGTWDIEIENTDGEKFGFNGSLCCSFEVDGKDLSILIRKYLGMPDLYCFDGAARVPIVKDEDEYIFVNVYFDDSDRTYCYLTDDLMIQEGDQVVVPVGNDVNCRIVEVESVVVGTADVAPYPVEKCRKIITRIED